MEVDGLDFGDSPALPASDVHAIAGASADGTLLTALVSRRAQANDY